MTYVFTIPIGDWSDDGHGKCTWYTIKSNKPVEDVREAYFRAKNLVSEKLQPEKICSAFGEMTVDKDIYDELLQEYPNIDTSSLDMDPAEYGDQIYISADFMVSLTVNFIKKGDPDLELEIVPNSPMLPFYGFDDQKRHIRYIGYGLFP